MYRFIQNIGDYFNPGYFTEDFKSNVFGTSGYDSEAIKEFNKRFSGLRQKYFDYKQSIIEEALPMKYVLKHTHDFHTVLLEALGYDPREPYSQWLYLDDSRVVPVCHILREGNQPQLLIMEMQPMIQRGENSKVEGLFEQQYSLPPDGNAEPARYRWNNWSLVDRHPVPEGCAISPKLINQAVEEIFYLPADQRPHYILMLAGNRVYLLEEKQFKRGSYLVFDLEELFAEVSIPANRDYYALFYLLCGKQSLASEGQSTLMDRLEEESTKNAFSVTKDLKEGVIHAVEGLANEAIYYIHEVRSEAIDETDDAFEQNVKDDCITIVYRLLFIFYAEARPELGILPTDNEVYLNGYSLDKLRDLESVEMQKPATQNGYFIHDSLWRLFSMIHNGYNESLIQQTKEAQDENDIPLSRTFAVKKIDSPLFDDSKLKVLGGIKYRNFVWQRIIRELSLTKPDSKHKTIGRISYANLGINQLGSVYESLLAYRGFYTEQDYAEVFKAGAEKDGTYLVPASRLDDFRHDEIKFGPDGELFTIPKGTFIYRLNGRDRKNSASFYTPEILTQSTVKYTLKGFVERLKDPNDSFKAADLLKLKILEPAMGAAAFQNEVINQLSELYITYREKELGKHVSPTNRRNEVQRVKAYIATKNVYGVDLNPTAIELGKLSLWLNVIHKNMETPFFGRRLALGNAVIGAWLKVYDKEDLWHYDGRKRQLECTEWWTKAPHKVHFDVAGKRVLRRKNEIYHFLVPDKNMLGVLSIAGQKKANPVAAKHMAEIRKGWIKPMTSEDIETLERLSKKIDSLLVKFQQYQHKVDLLTGNNFTVWGMTGTHQMNTPMSYDQKEDLYNTRNSQKNEYYKLHRVMDYWCALWFWPYDKADMLPTRDEYWHDIDGILDIDLAEEAKKQRSILRGPVKNGMEDMFGPKEYVIDFGAADDKTEVNATQPSADEANENDEDDADVVSDQEASQIMAAYVSHDALWSSPRLPIVEQLANQYHFFHPMLEFIEVFWLRNGFDIILGNPPWVLPSYDVLNIVGEKFPEILINDYSAPQIRTELRRYFSLDNSLRPMCMAELTETSCTNNFFRSVAAYPLIHGIKTDLYMPILETCFDMANPKSYIGMVHPESLFDGNGLSSFRNEAYHKLFYHFQYENELNLFTGTNDHGRMKFGENIYGPRQNKIHFASISNLFTPETIDGCFAHDGHGISHGIKWQGHWNTIAHRDRIVTIDERALKAIATVFENNVEEKAPKLIAFQTESSMKVIEKLSENAHNVLEYRPIITTEFNEAIQVDDGTIERITSQPNSNDDITLNGPHIYLSNPLYKMPRAKVNSNSAYDIIDFTKIGEDFVPATCFRPLISHERMRKYVKGFVVGQDAFGKPIYDYWADYYKLGISEWVGSAAERTLTGGILAPNTHHVGTIVSVTFKNYFDLLELCGLINSLPLDFYIKITGTSHIKQYRINVFPMGIDERYKNALYGRVLLLNCLTKHYSELWKTCWKESYKSEHWSIVDPRLKPFSDLTESWTWETPLRNYFERRQALVEIDVIAAMALGLSLKDLEMIYSIQFPVLQQNEGDTWYDQKGNIVFTCSKGLTGVGCDRPEWNAIRGTVSADGNSYDGNGEPYTHTIDPKKSELYGGQQVAYYPPYTHPDRIQDYRRAWAFFEKRFNDLM